MVKCSPLYAGTYQLGDDSRNTCASGERECALLHNLGVALLIRVLHCDDNLGSRGVADEIHGTAEALDLSGKHPVGKVAVGAHLHGAKNGEIDSSGANHAEALLAAKYGGTGVEGDGLLASVDEVSILKALLGVRAEAENAILGLQLNLDFRSDEAGGEHWHADTQVGVHAVLELLGGAANDALALGRGFTRAEGGLSGRVVCVLAKGKLFNVLGSGALDDTLDVDAGQMNGLGRNLTGLDNVLGLNDGHLGVAAHGAVEVVGGEAELAIAELVGLVGLDKGIVASDAVLEEIGLAVEDLDVLGVRVLGGGTVGVVLEGKFSGLDDGAIGCRGVKGGDTLAACGASFSESTLRGQLELDLAGEVHGFKGFVLANIAGNHLLDLLGFEELAQARVVGTGVVGDGCETSKLGPVEDLVNEGIRNTAKTKTTAEQGAVGLHVFDGLGGRRENLVDLCATDRGGKGSGKDGSRLSRRGELGI